MNGKRTIGVAMIVACAAGLTLSACATIIHSGRQEVAFSSTPSGASVQVDNADQGKTPLVAKLSRKQTHTVAISMPGYKSYEMTLNRKVSGWVWGNIVFGGLIGLGVDAIGGGMYRLEPEQVSAALATTQASVVQPGDGLFVIATLKPDPSWRKIAQLEHE